MRIQLHIIYCTYCTRCNGVGWSHAGGHPQLCGTCAGKGHIKCSAPANQPGCPR